MRRNAGFTLIEVMAAFVIAGLAILVLLRAGAHGAVAARDAGMYQQALERAQSRLASIGPLTPLRAAALSGEDGGGFRWALAVTPLQSAAGLTLYRVRVTEFFGARQLTIETVRLGPAP